MVERIPFLDVVRGMQCILDKKSGQDGTPIRIQVSNAGMVLTISDGSIFMESNIDLIENPEEAIEFYLSAPMLYDLIRQTSSKNVQFLIDEKTVTVKYNEGQFLLSKLLSIRNYMCDVTFSSGSFCLATNELMESLKVLKTVMPTSEIRDHFQGVSFMVETDNITLWTIDGFKICVDRIKYSEQNFAESAQNRPLDGIWPRKFVETLMANNTQNKIEMSISDRYVRCRLGKTVITSPLVNVKPIKYIDMLPRNAEPTMKISANASQIDAGLNRLMILMQPGDAVKFRLNDSGLVMSSSNKQKSDEGIENVEAKYTGASQEFFINPSTFGFLRHMKDKTVEISFYRSGTVGGTIVLCEEGKEYPLLITKAMMNMT